MFSRPFLPFVLAVFAFLVMQCPFPSPNFSPRHKHIILQKSGIRTESFPFHLDFKNRHIPPPPPSSRPDPASGIHQFDDENETKKFKVSLYAMLSFRQPMKNSNDKEMRQKQRNRVGWCYNSVQGR
ncbi:hypothetical protein B0T21DRAFT_150152 [Apiosordaria backusii]|uniref:Transmembrane protein n=1 Tax=Apiosordaria backusii TaxID=314023 RepID=A0AA40BT46_9PEZI|nr:hypothetical protein B0T21DRAFT_150152 [Apiosordaria backusii]